MPELDDSFCSRRASLARKRLRMSERVILGEKSLLSVVVFSRYDANKAVTGGRPSPAE